MNRRRYLVLGSSALAAGLAGCSGSSSNGGDGTGSETGGGTATTTSSGSEMSESGTATDTSESTTAGSEMTDESSAATTSSSLSPDENPQELVVQFYRYLDAGDTEAAAALVHPESPSRGESGEVFSDSESVQAMERDDVTVRSASRLPWRFSDDDSRTVIEALVSLSADSEAQTIQWEVRQVNGNWRIWATTEPQSG